MALTPYYISTAKDPLKTTGGQLGTNALTRWLNQQKRSQEQFSAAEQPLRQSVQMFQPGGGYGRGQATLLREESRRAQAEATTQQVARGMSSGSLATGTKMRTERDLATNLAGVQDVRTQFLTQALSNLSGLRGQQAGLTTQVNDPTLAPMLSYLTNVMNLQSQESQNVIRANTAMQSRSAPSNNKPQPQQQGTFSTPRF